MKTIELTQGQVALVDDEDYGWLSQHKWCALWRKIAKTFYAVRVSSKDSAGKRKMIMMHRVIMGASAGEDVDHIFWDTLDNRKEMLRVCSRRVNTANRKGKQTGKYSSAYTGVTWHKKAQKWQAQIRIGQHKKYLGLFDSEIQASEAHQKELAKNG